jgi:predicted TIM-barrel fold metal-dependent hydrolase
MQLIDADAHVNPPPIFWRDYLPAKLVDQAPRIEEGAPGETHDWLVFEGRRTPLNVMTSVVGQGRKFRPTGRQSELRLGTWAPEARLADMAQDGVDHAVLFGGGPLGAADNELYLASFEAYNHWLADFCSYAPDKLTGVAYLPMQEVEHSIRMLEDAADRGLKGVNIPAFPQSGKGSSGGGYAAQLLALTGDPNGSRQYDSEEFDPFWKACVDRNMAVTIHLGARAASPGIARFLPNLVMSKVSMAEPIAIMIFGGVFDRHPELRFGSIESGAGWMAWMATYMDDIYNNQRHWLQLELKHKPSHYMDQNVYASFIRDPLAVQNRHLPGGRNSMWSTDYPHSETTWPDSQASLVRHFGDLSEEERRPIVCDNARRFFAL